MPDLDKGAAGQILEALRPARLPPGMDALTLGDLALAAALGLLLAALVALLWPRPIRGRAPVAAGAVAELRRTRALPPEDARLAQARVLRRVVAARDGPAAAALAGPDFAAHLDHTFATDFFTAGAGRALVAGLYEPAPAGAPEIVAERLEALVRRVGV